jgi:hypothetical protein
VATPQSRCVARTFLAVALPAHGLAGGSSCLPAENTVTARTGPWLSPSPVAALNFRLSNIARCLRRIREPAARLVGSYGIPLVYFPRACVASLPGRHMACRATMAARCARRWTRSRRRRGAFLGGTMIHSSAACCGNERGGSAQPNRGTRRWMLTKARWRLPCGRS